MYFNKLQECMKTLLQRDIKLTINSKVLREGKLILFNLKDYYIECTLINKNNQQKIYEIPVPFTIDIKSKYILFDYGINSVSKGDIDNKLTIKMLASNIGKKSKFYDNTLTIEY